MYAEKVHEKTLSQFGTFLHNKMNLAFRPTMYSIDESFLSDQLTSPIGLGELTVTENTSGISISVKCKCNVHHELFSTVSEKQP